VFDFVWGVSVVGKKNPSLISVANLFDASTKHLKLKFYIARNQFFLIPESQKQTKKKVIVELEVEEGSVAGPASVELVDLKLDHNDLDPEEQPTLIKLSPNSQTADCNNELQNNILPTLVVMPTPHAHPQSTQHPHPPIIKASQRQLDNSQPQLTKKIWSLSIVSTTACVFPLSILFCWAAIMRISSTHSKILFVLFQLPVEGLLLGLYCVMLSDAVCRRAGLHRGPKKFRPWWSYVLLAVMAMSLR
jgi:hypothetical protein